ncbi:olfactory receptor 142-like [Pleuronectes platessa]|uniref:olfactory receptor 142-like n=1 Tax=Pleuronectes platessa TaxID=8262 RepID=UPI00232A6141|nr:olfactory receptor 142-like [Pleuronectes platessa]
MDNVSVVSMFTLSGLSGTAHYRVTLFILTLLCYCVIWLVNVTIIVTIIVDKNLHEPMYIFLCNLCINALYGTAGFYPKFLSDLLSASHVISYSGCLLQGFVLHSSVIADISILLLMAYDRYVAICQPLIYHSVMTKGKIGMYVFFAWLVPHYLMIVSTITTAITKICGSHIPKIYCINYLVNRLACTPPLASVIVPAFNYTVWLIYAAFIFWSYMCLIKNCLHSGENRSKFMQTCLPHLLCLNTVVISMFFDLMYVRFGTSTIPQSLKNFMGMEFLVVPPILNPLIYGLKLTKIRNRIVQFFLRKN